MEKDIHQLLQAGIRAHRSGRYEEAEEFYRIILKQDPTHADANHNIGLLATQFGHAEASLAFFIAALKKSPEQPQFWVSYFKALVGSNKIEIASDVLEEMRSLNLESLTEKRMHELEQQLLTATKVNDSSETQAIEKLLLNYKGGIFREAIGQARRILVTFPNNLVVQNIFALTLMALNENEKAVKSFNRAICMDPFSSDLYGNVGVLLKREGRYPDALKNQRKKIVLAPQEANGYSNAGNIFTLEEMYDEAIAICLKAITAGPNFADGYDNLGTALLSKKNFEQAILAFDKAINNKPNNSSARSKKLECFLSLGKKEAFKNEISEMKKENDSNIMAAMISSYAAEQWDQPDEYPFCPAPLSFIRVGSISDHICDSHTYIDQLLKEIDTDSLVWEPSGKTTKLGYQTPSNLFPSQRTNLKTLEELIKKELRLYYDTFKDTQVVMMQRWPKNYNLIGWFVRLLENGFQDTHVHTDGWVSGVVYLKTIEVKYGNDGAIEFGSHCYNLPSFGKAFSTSLHKPKAGDILIFPSSLPHKTIPFKGINAERCIISFDLVP